MTLARKEANILHEKISDKAYNDEELIRIISTRSKAQLSATFNHYNDHHGHEIIKVKLKHQKDLNFFKSALFKINSIQDFTFILRKEALNQQCHFESLLQFLHIDSILVPHPKYNCSLYCATMQDLEADDDDEYLKLLRAAIECLKTPEKYFEKVLRLAIKKLGTDEWDLTRVVSTRAEVDMERIKEEYHRRNTVTLDRAIAADTSGDYEKMLLALIGHGDA